MAEMALDTFIQQQRIAIGGIGELRGNGQFVRRAALERCGGWNEQTITDDLDLTIRLHLDKWDIQFLDFPPVEEEGVTTALALWHQRNRWGECQIGAALLNVTTLPQHHPSKDPEFSLKIAPAGSMHDASDADGPKCMFFATLPIEAANLVQPTLL